MESTRGQALCWSAAVILVVLLTGCMPGGQLAVGADSSAVCAVQPEHGIATYGNVVRNEGNSPLILKTVSLVDAENLEIHSARIMPMQGSSPYVVGTGSTEPGDPDAQAAWQEALDVESYRIAPGDSVNVVVALDNGDQSTGMSRALRIDYRQGSFEFSAETNMALTLADDSCPPAH